MKTDNNHWAVCFSDGSVRYDEDNRAEIYGTRKIARERIKELPPDEKLHPELVVIG